VFTALKSEEEFKEVVGAGYQLGAEPQLSSLASI
jgi:hypothetical protein